VLHHNLRGDYFGLPRTAGWGYPEPYTRDLLICGLGAMASGDAKLMKALRRVLATLAKNQSAHGHIPSLVHDPEDRGASDTTPLFLMILGMFRRVTGQSDFLDTEARLSHLWMAHQNPSDRVMVAQQPTTDWRDEQWVCGFGLYVNTVYYAALRLFNIHKRADHLFDQMHHFTIKGFDQHRHVHEGLVVKHKPYFAMWAFKIFSSERFDLLGNSLAILTGLATPTRARQIGRWIGEECDELRKNTDLCLDLPPNFFPYVRPTDPEWSERYAIHNRPGQYHNGGIWPFVCGFYVAAIVAAGRRRIAERALLALTDAVRRAKDPKLAFGFNEYLWAQDGRPGGHDWQSWSAAMYLYAAACVREGRALFFEEVAGGDCRDR